MYPPTTAGSRQTPSVQALSELWLRSQRWDLLYITGSSVLVVLPLLLYALMGQAALLVNMVIAGVIGGPHLYATFFRTFLDAAFWREHRWLACGSCGIPVLVVACAFWHFPLLLTLFFFWASLHVLHQITYLLDCYERKQHRRGHPWTRYIDYAVVVSCLYPFAARHFIYGEFAIGKTPLLYPTFLKTPLVYYAIVSVFLVALCLFIGKTLWELHHGTAHYPKILLIGTTVSLALVSTSYSGHRLEIAFQGLNTWHSFQYLAISWYMHMLRQERGEMTSVMPWVARSITDRFWPFYGITFALTCLSLLLILLCYGVSGFSFEQSYYVVVLSCLLIHYCHDHFLFTRVEDMMPAQHPENGAYPVTHTSGEKPAVG